MWSEKAMCCKDVWLKSWSLFLREIARENAFFTRQATKNRLPDLPLGIFLFAIPA